MRKIGIILLLIVMSGSMVTRTWATSVNLEEKIRIEKIATEVEIKALPLTEALALLSKRSGVRIIATPEVADVIVDLQLGANETLEQALITLATNYGLTFQMNNKQNTVVMLKGTYITKAMVGSRKEAGSVNDKMRMDVAYQAMMPQASHNTLISAYPIGHYSTPLPNTEEYKAIYDNQFQKTLDTPLSTFSIDVDTASYSNVRRFLNSGKLPPADGVRTEELLNYFTYDYQQPRGEEPFSITTEIGDCPWQPHHKVVMIGLQGKQIALEELPPSNLTFLIDVSGSMGAANRLPLLKTTFKMLVKELREQDKVSIVVYAGQAGVVLEPTSGSDKKTILAAIDTLQAGGSTAGGEGLELAYKIAKESFMKEGNNRVILATDGDFNVGVSSEGELTKLIEKRRDDGIFLSVLGFGMGNLKDNKMETLADKGNGNYAYIDNALEAKKSMVSQLAGTLYTIAKDVKLQVEFNPGLVKGYRLIGYENRVLEKADFNNDKKDAGDMGAGHSVTALYEIIPVGEKEVGSSVDPLVYQKSQTLVSDELLQIKVRYKKPNQETSMLITKAVNKEEQQAVASENLRFASAVAEYAMLLRSSEFKGQASYEQVLELAREAKGKDKEGYRAEFIRLVELSQLFDEK